MQSIVHSIVLALIVATCVSGSRYKSPADIPNSDLLQYMGSTATKEFYISVQVDSAMYDYAYALHHACYNIFDMYLASIENEEEFEVINSYLMRELSNSTSSSKAWTSGLAFGRMGKQWASTGAQYNLNAVISYPWPSGGGASPSWSWNQCLSVYKNCNRSPGAPPGCFPIRTELFYDDCQVKRQVICQRAVQ
ncbi:unnamed protein product [Allacma fusca]|uniref:C-type lectin domain-containing protein n=1 Tax=Allacma fusca TaxID=39272 RepID=A0A8J2LG60_9HEXA|nr:unnamed protein product [Allacma fusca]